MDAQQTSGTDWLTVLQASLFAIVYGLYYTLRFLIYAVYIILIPLHYPLYYILAAIAFLLSPVYYIAMTLANAGLMTASFVAKFKYLYIYFACAAVIGICAAAMLHGTSSLTFIMLGLHPSQQPARRPGSQTAESEEYEMDSYADRFSASSSSGRASRAAPSWGARKSDDEDPWSNQLKLIHRSPDVKFRRTRGLLAQTIHEESGSDSP